MTDTITLRPNDSPCRYCKESTRGCVDTVNGQDTVRCQVCGKWLYNAPKTETGRETRPVTDNRHVSTSRRERILERDGGRCVLCGATVDLHVDHILPLKMWKGRIDESRLNSDDNLWTLCNACNLGKGKWHLPPLWLVAALLSRKHKESQNDTTRSTEQVL